MIQCISFWENPSKASCAWLALFYGILACAVWIEHSMHPDTAEAPPPEIFKYYHEKCAVALTLSNYCAPGRYKVEAATIHLGVEYLQSDGLKTGSSVLLSMVSRLAIMMGYHRDPRIYPGLSPFEGEMRRRQWLILSLIDYFVSWQSGLPIVIPKGISDTAPPRILLDQNLDVNMTILPLSQPETETPNKLTYVLAQERLMVAANLISESLEACTRLEKTIKLEQQLDAAWNDVPINLKRSIESRVDCDTMICILTLEMTYQRARCILYRRYLINGHDEPIFDPFRTECISAAQKVLYCQTELFEGIFSQPQYSHKVWFGISRSICDCLTAAMVISLAILNRVKRSQVIGNIPSGELIETLNASYTSWKQCPRSSLETIKAADILKTMLCLIESNTGTMDCMNATNTNAKEQIEQDLWLNSSEYAPNQAANFYSLLQPTQSLETLPPFSGFDMVDFVRPPFHPNFISIFES